MSRLQNLPYVLHQSFLNNSALKIISGLNNFDESLVKQVSKAAAIGGADFLDIACSPHLVKVAIENSNLPVCVSSVEPNLFPPAVEAGAEIIEIGNFDSFYPKGKFFNAKEVLDLAVQSRKILPDIVLSVTVPHILPFDQQAKLALDLVDVGVDLIQTEGGTSTSPVKPGALGLIEKAAPTLAAVHSIYQGFLEVSCKTPLICASGLSEVTLPMALGIGASGVGVGSVVNRLNNELEMIAMIRNLKSAMKISRNSEVKLSS